MKWQLLLIDKTASLSLRIIRRSTTTKKKNTLCNCPCFRSVTHEGVKLLFRSLVLPLMEKSIVVGKVNVLTRGTEHHIFWADEPIQECSRHDVARGHTPFRRQSVKTKQQRANIVAPRFSM